LQAGGDPPEIALLLPLPLISETIRAQDRYARPQILHDTQILFPRIRNDDFFLPKRDKMKFQQMKPFNLLSKCPNLLKNPCRIGVEKRSPWSLCPHMVWRIIFYQKPACLHFDSLQK